MPAPKPTNTIIEAAIAGFEAQKQRLDAQIAEFRRLMIGGTAEPAAQSAPPVRNGGE